MTQYKIAVNKDILHHLLSSNDEGMKELLKQILDQILEQQRTEQINAERYERTEERRGRRNGYKTRNLITKVGWYPVPLRGERFSPRACSIKKMTQLCPFAWVQSNQGWITFNDQVDQFRVDDRKKMGGI
jgi:hypothetical protein